MRVPTRDVGARLCGRQMPETRKRAREAGKSAELLNAERMLSSSTLMFDGVETQFTQTRTRPHAPAERRMEAEAQRSADEVASAFSQAAIDAAQANDMNVSDEEEVPVEEEEDAKMQRGFNQLVTRVTEHAMRVAQKRDVGQPRETVTAEAVQEAVWAIERRNHPNPDLMGERERFPYRSLYTPSGGVQGQVLDEVGLVAAEAADGCPVLAARIATSATCALTRITPNYLEICRAKAEAQLQAAVQRQSEEEIQKARDVVLHIEDTATNMARTWSQEWFLKLQRDAATNWELRARAANGVEPWPNGQCLDQYYIIDEMDRAVQQPPEKHHHAAAVLAATERARIRSQRDYDTESMVEIARWPQYIFFKDEELKVEPPSAFLCPITHCIMHQPAMTPAGITYDYNSIVQWIDAKQKEPQSGQPLSPEQLLPNRAMHELIEAFVEKHTPTP